MLADPLAGRVEPAAVDMAREAAMAFIEADLNGDHQLTFEEFKLAVPERMKKKESLATLEHLFSVADADSNGYVTMHEYFMWVLTVAVQGTGTGLEAVFRRYDRNNEGNLDAREFAMACEDMGESATHQWSLDLRTSLRLGGSSLTNAGFGELAHDIFMELDGDESGSVSYSELMSLLRSREHLVSQPCKKFLTELAFSGGRSSEPNPREPERHDPPAEDSLTHRAGSGMLSTIAPNWHVKAVDEDGLRRELNARLQEAGAKTSDLYRFMTSRKGKTVSLTLKEFTLALKAVGWSGSAEALADVFLAMDGDRSGVIGVGELNEWLHGRLSRRQRAKLVEKFKRVQNSR